jgi:flavin reductase (DIM6/NTAB) family NADH-FMN oxidoreductase RutF
MRSIDASKAYRLMEPGPIVLVTTAQSGKDNVMTMGFHMVVQHSPPLLGCIIGPWDHSYKALVETGECVIAIPGADLAEKVVGIGNCSGADVDKFKRFGLKRAAPAVVSAPLIADCLANLECRVSDTSLTDRFNLFILEVVAISYNDDRRERRMLHHQGDGTFTADGEVFDLKKKMVLWKEFQVDL